MTQSEYDKLLSILNAPNERFKALPRIEAYLATITPKDEPEGNSSPSKAITDNQLHAWFLWLTMIEKLAENEGITWNQVVGQTHQLRITKNGLHEMGKQLMEALWGITSIKQVEKQGHIDILIDHFTDLFSKVGLELPPFPEDSSKGKDKLQGITKAREMEYPEDIGQPTF